ncbi:MAG: hypothetical protein ACLU3M_07935 [Oscillospiraceae bacterium]|nr:hypothetical protein [Oscillospiraceae bacterium]
MTTHKNITRILAVLLAVLLFGQLAAFQIPAFAADVVPDVHDGAAYIPDDADVNELLSQTLLSNYSDVGTQEWEYKATSTLSGGATKWVPVTGTTAGIIPALTAGKAGFPALDVLGVSYPALDSQSPAQDYAVRLKGTTEVYTFTKLAQPADADTDTPADTPAQTPDTTPADTPEEPADTPETSGETYQVNIPYTANGDIDFDALRAAIAAAVLPDADAASVTVTYESKAILPPHEPRYVVLEGGWDSKPILREFPAIGVGTYQVKLTAGGTDTIVTVTLTDARANAKIVLKEGVSVTYTKDAAAMRTQILDKLVDWSQTTVSKEAAAKSMVIEYKTKGYLPNISTNKLSPELWFPIEGGSASSGALTYTASSLGAGENQQVRASFPTTADYHGCDAAEGTLTVDKANVRVKVQAAAISAGETLTTQQYVTTNPEDTFAIFKVYSGVTSGLSGIVYVQLPESMVSETALKMLDPIVKPILGKTLAEALRDGTTVGELRAFLKDNQKLLDGAADFLKLIGVDITAFTKLVDTLNSLPSVFDSTRVAFGSPNRAGMYLVTAIASNPNYNPGIGTGVLVVKMHISGASLSWNNSETTYAVSALKADTLNATLMRGDSAADNQDGVHYRYIGFTAAHKLYVSSKAPTEAGTYRQTAYIFGGNDMAKSISRTVTITAD